MGVTMRPNEFAILGLATNCEATPRCEQKPRTSRNTNRLSVLRIAVDYDLRAVVNSGLRYPSHSHASYRENRQYTTILAYSIRA